MLSVIIDARAAPDRLMGLLAALAEGVVGGVVREVQIIAAPSEAVETLCEETGARTAADMAQALAAARSDLVLVAPAAFRPRLGWPEALVRHFRDGTAPVRLSGEGAGFLRPAAGAVAGPRARMKGADFAAISRALRGVRTL
jgi:hypothetical protein